MDPKNWFNRIKDKSSELKDKTIHYSEQKLTELHSKYKSQTAERPQNNQKQHRPFTDYMGLFKDKFQSIKSSQYTNRFKQALSNYKDKGANSAADIKQKTSKTISELSQSVSKAAEETKNYPTRKATQLREELIGKVRGSLKYILLAGAAGIVIYCSVKYIPKQVRIYMLQKQKMANDKEMTLQRLQHELELKKLQLEKEKLKGSATSGQGGYFKGPYQDK